MITDLCECTKVHEVYDFLNKVLLDYYDDTFILISQLDEKLRIPYCYSVSGVKKKKYSRVIELLGMNPVGKTFKLTKEADEHFYKPYLRKFPGSLSDFAEGQVPEVFCHMLERYFDIREIYTMGLNHKGRELASVFLVFTKEAKVEQFQGVEKFLRACAQRIYEIVYTSEITDESIQQLEQNFIHQFFNNISHELRTPLNGILGLLDTMSRRDLSKSHQKRLMENVWHSSKDLVRTMENIILLSQLQTNSYKLKQETFTSEELLFKLKKYINRIDEDYKRCEIRTNLTKESNIFRVDKELLRFALKEIIDNAVKFSGNERVIIELNFGENLEIEVQDFGSGMTEEERDNIFRIFYKCNGSETTQKRGIGAGLAICKAAVDLLRGKLNLASELGQGTRVSVQIPSGTFVKQKIPIG